MTADESNRTAEEKQKHERGEGKRQAVTKIKRPVLANHAKLLQNLTFKQSCCNKITQQLSASPCIWGE